MTPHLAHLSDNDVGIKEVRIGSVVRQKTKGGQSASHCTPQLCVVQRQARGAGRGRCLGSDGDDVLINNTAESGTSFTSTLGVPAGHDVWCVDIRSERNS